MILEVYVHQSAHGADESDLRSGLEETLKAYTGQISHGVFRLQRRLAAPAEYECRIDLGVRWWGRLSVAEVDADPRAAAERAMTGLTHTLDAFVGDLC
jgi:hypothetical protein